MAGASLEVMVRVEVDWEELGDEVELRDSVLLRAEEVTLTSDVTTALTEAEGRRSEVVTVPPVCAGAVKSPVVTSCVASCLVLTLETVTGATATDLDAAPAGTTAAVVGEGVMTCVVSPPRRPDTALRKPRS